MSIANELTRLLSAKSDIAAVMKEKSVSMPEEFRLEDVSGLIASLSNTCDDTVTAETLAEGFTAHDKNGVSIVGTMVPRSEFSVTDDGDGNIVLITSDLSVSDEDGNVTVIQRSV